MLNQLNTEIFYAINRFAGSNFALDKIAIVTAKYLPLLFVLFLLYLWIRNTTYKHISLYAGYSAIVGLLINFLITAFYFHPRPFMNNVGTLLIRHAPDTSFPSDHTTFMLSIASMLVYYQKTRILGIILFIMGLIGGVSRIYCGLHYPFDVFGSLMVAIISSGIIFAFQEKLHKLNILIIALYNKIFKHEN